MLFHIEIIKDFYYIFFILSLESEDEDESSCKFPFEYKGTVHNKCTYDMPDRSRDDYYAWSLVKPWCATKIPFNSNKKLKSCSSIDESEEKGNTAQSMLKV